MKNYIGIDLGTTNSAICSYDGENVRIWKSPEQADVTPSAVYIDKRGRKRVGKRAYEQLAHDPERVAVLFKRLIGSNTKIIVENSGNNGTPEEWSAEILKALFGYLPEEKWPTADTGIVITVPAAFDEMQKAATMEAANAADLGNVALMQEPVAAVMATMRHRKKDGLFLIYDLGGGTLDIAVAQSIGGRVQLLAHGGIGFCGGRDIDRLLVEKIILPYLKNNFSLPEDFATAPAYKNLMRAAPYLAEEAKINLSTKDSAVLATPDSLNIEDKSGEEIFFEIPITREELNTLIDDKIDETIAEARETIKKAGLEPDEIDQIIFIGGPTNYKPLRDKVAGDLGIEANIDVNPMTAVAEGAAIFAESIDWSTRNRLRKSPRGQLKGDGIQFNYNARTPGNTARIAAQLEDKSIQGAEFEIVSLDTGWNSGRMALKHGAGLELDLPKKGENKFRVAVFASDGAKIKLENDEITIARVAATIDAIPGNSIGIEIEDKEGGKRLDYIIRAGDKLPKAGEAKYRAAVDIHAGQAESLRLRLWEGEITTPIDDNLFIGVLEITGFDFDGGVIRKGTEIICNYEILDSGEIKLSVFVPSVGAMLDKNFYSPRDGQIDFATATAQIQDACNRTMERMEELSRQINDPRLEKARKKLEFAETLLSDNSEIEKNKEADENIHQAKKLIYQARQDYLPEIREKELEGCVKYFDDVIRKYARLQEATQFDNLARTARRYIKKNDSHFEVYLSQMRNQNFQILWRQDWYAEQIFNSLKLGSSSSVDKEQHKTLVQLGETAIEQKNYRLLRTIIEQLYDAQPSQSESMEDDFGKVNIYKA